MNNDKVNLQTQILYSLTSLFSNFPNHLIQTKHQRSQTRRKNLLVLNQIQNQNMKNLPKQKHLSSSVINAPSKSLTQSKTLYDHINQSMDSQMLKQSTKQLQNYLFYSNNSQTIKPNSYLMGDDNSQIIDNIDLKNIDTSRTSSFVGPRQLITKNKENYYDLSDSQRFGQYKKENQHQAFYRVQQAQIYEEQLLEDSIPNRSKSARNLRSFNEKNLKLSTENESNGPPPSQFYSKKEGKKSLNQNLQHKVIYENFSPQDLNFLSDQQFLPLGMYPQIMKKSSSKNTSKRSESNHPVFRDTLNYVDAEKNINNIKRSHFMNMDAESRKLSDDESQDSIPLTNIDSRSSYRSKYKKYKIKHANAIQVIRQLQALNETLINDQRENFHYYENTIKDLENTLMIKDKEIDQLNHLLLNYQNEQEKRYQVPCSIDGRQMEFENQKLKKELEVKTKQINKFKEQANLNISEAQQKKEGSTKNLQKKYDLLKKQKESFCKKVNTLEELNKMYESKLKEKQERLNKLSELNSDLQQQIIKLKGKMRSDATYDTERSVEQDLPKRSKNQHLTFSTQTFNKYPIVVSQPKLESASQIQKYLTCIDQQLQLIRTSMKQKDDQKGVNISQFQKKQMSELDSISDFQFDNDSKNKLQVKALQNVVQKLSNFRASMGV